MPRALIALSLLVLVLSGISFGQGPVGTLTGTVTDPAGSVVPGATVIATNDATKVETKTTTTGTGTYTMPSLPAGTYTLRVTSAGFRTATAENVILRLAQTGTVDIKLEVGAVTEQVVVSDTPELLESGSAEVGRYITPEEYKSWPVVVGDGQRQIQQFIFDSLPGTTGDTFKGSINGGQEYSHEILIEGIPIGAPDRNAFDQDLVRVLLATVDRSFKRVARGPWQAVENELLDLPLSIADHYRPAFVLFGSDVAADFRGTRLEQLRRIAYHHLFRDRADFELNIHGPRLRYAENHIFCRGRAESDRKSTRLNS